MNKFFILLILFFSVNQIFSCAPFKKVLFNISKQIPQNQLLQHVLVLHNDHTGSVLDAARLSVEKQQDAIINGLIHLENSEASEKQVKKQEKAMNKFFEKVKKVSNKNSVFFDTAHKNMNFHGRRNYAICSR
ncbi:MAG: Asp-tRNA(Asn)/Glu-tRNA(Gln) amidotransferase C subunit [Alteromonas naphthalenivorans]|jgi:Asp-tRNA(Asn)/Glu-tRNA(Gln) amidotransferase C subunit